MANFQSFNSKNNGFIHVEAKDVNCRDVCDYFLQVLDVYLQEILANIPAVHVFGFYMNKTVIFTNKRLKI